MEGALKQGHVLCIFPEGKITKNGQINPFRDGIKRLIDKQPATVVPLALRNLWGSMFSRCYKFRLPRKLFAKIELQVGEPIDAKNLSVKDLQAKVLALRGDKF
jgi:1-acyl-sn-glycerol-3-phosphate acyltransferase